MKITAVEPIAVDRFLFVKVHTDEGITGLGESGTWGYLEASEKVMEKFGRYLVGQDPLRIEHHWQAIFRGQFYRGGPVLTSALSGIEQAMWDIKGKVLGVPAYELLGGAVRDKVRVYAHVGGATADALVESAQKRVAQGFNALKTGFFGATQIVDTQRVVLEAVEKMAAVREAVGPDVDIGVDFHGRISPAMAVRLAQALEPYYPMFIEEPCLPENVDTMVTIARSTSIPVATGERLFTRWGFREVLEKQAAVILQPDLSHAGGIFECRKIAAMAEVYYAAIAPHCPLGPIALAACLQLDACTPNFLCQEQVNLGEGYLTEPFRVEEGHVPVPTKPGLGIELDEEAVAQKLYDGSWETPRLWFHDGSVADW